MVRQPRTKVRRPRTKSDARARGGGPPALSAPLAGVPLAALLALAVLLAADGWRTALLALLAAAAVAATRIRYAREAAAALLALTAALALAGHAPAHDERPGPRHAGGHHRHGHHHHPHGRAARRRAR